MVAPVSYITHSQISKRNVEQVQPHLVNKDVENREYFIFALQKVFSVAETVKPCCRNITGEEMMIPACGTICKSTTLVISQGVDDLNL